MATFAEQSGNVWQHHRKHVVRKDEQATHKVQDSEQRTTHIRQCRGNRMFLEPTAPRFVFWICEINNGQRHAAQLNETKVQRCVVREHVELERHVGQDRHQDVMDDHFWLSQRFRGKTGRNIPHDELAENDARKLLANDMHLRNSRRRSFISFVVVACSEPSLPSHYRQVDHEWKTHDLMCRETRFLRPRSMRE